MVYTNWMSERTEAFEAGKAASDYWSRVGGGISQPIMLGDHPSGATSAEVSALGDKGSAWVDVYAGKKHIGTMTVKHNTIDNIQTHSDHRNKGVATMMDRMANFELGKRGASKPAEHSEVRTPAGEAWAKSVGGKLPDRVPSFGMSGNPFRNL